jgi:hypothetical protein
LFQPPAQEARPIKTRRPELQRFDQRASAYTFRSEPVSMPFLLRRGTVLACSPAEAPCYRHHAADVLWLDRPRSCLHYPLPSKRISQIPGCHRKICTRDPPGSHGESRYLERTSNRMSRCRCGTLAWLLVSNVEGTIYINTSRGRPIVLSLQRLQ